MVAVDQLGGGIDMSQQLVDVLQRRGRGAHKAEDDELPLRHKAQDLEIDSFYAAERQQEAVHRQLIEQPLHERLVSADRMPEGTAGTGIEIRADANLARPLDPGQRGCVELEQLVDSLFRGIE